jgi:S-DNA-T family DNA segregation ATPase FtsK/SpoIIIE
MSLKGNQFKTNSFKQNTETEKGNQRSSAREPRVKADILPSFDLQNGRLIKIAGLFFIILSIYFLVAFTSYLFTWQEDQSYVIDANGGWSNLFKTVEELQQNGVKDPIVQNWLGKIGALLSHQFIY